MKKLKDVDRQQILKLINEGKETKEIRSILKYKFTMQQIAAVRAWNTMRERVKSIGKVVDLTDAIRKRIINMIHKKMSTVDIMERLKYQYSRQQIAAVRAWMTMGKY